jgi:hypothetical protein
VAYGAQDIYLAGDSGTDVPFGYKDGSFFGSGLRAPHLSNGVVLPAAGTASHLYVSVFTTEPGAVHAVFSVLRNGQRVSLKVVLSTSREGSGSRVSKTDLSDQATFAPGDIIAMRIDSLVNTRFFASWSLVYEHPTG